MPRRFAFVCATLAVFGLVFLMLSPFTRKRRSLPSRAACDYRKGQRIQLITLTGNTRAEANRRK